MLIDEGVNHVAGIQLISRGEGLLDNVVCARRVPEGNPLGGKRFELRAPDLDDPIEGTTTGDGRAECSVPVDLTRAQLVVWGSDDKMGIRHVWDVELGGLYAPESDEGIRQRLNNLGYHAGGATDSQADTDGAEDRPSSDDDDESKRAQPLSLAVAAFQEDHGLEVTGVADDETRAKIVEAHGKT